MSQQTKRRKTTKGSKHLQNTLKITSTQAAVLITSTMIGVGVLTLPRSSTEAAHQFGWWSVLTGLLLSIAAVFVIYKLGARFPDRTLVGICEQVFGSKRHAWVGRVLSAPVLIFFFAYWAILTAIIARTFGEVVVTAVLTNTPLEVIVGTMLMLCFVVASYEEEVVARINEVLLLLIVVPILFISFSAYQNARLEYIMPFFPTKKHYMDVLSGVLPSLSTYLGFDVVMMFNRGLEREKNIFRAHYYGVLIPGVVYLLIVIAGIMSFGYEELSKQAWPTLELIKSVNVPGLILERMEAVFLGVWVAAVFTSAGNYFYCSVCSFTEQFRIRKQIWVVLVFIVGTYYMAMWPKNINEMFTLLEWMGYFGLAESYVLPGLLLLLAALRKLDESGYKGSEEGQRREAEVG